MKWLKNNNAEILIGLGLTFFLITYLGEEFILSVPLLVIGLILLYKRHFRSSSFGNASFLSGLSNNDESDEDLYEDAKEAVIEAGKASTSYLQRTLRIGYSRSARLMDMLEERGVIGPAFGSEPRKVIKKDDTLV